MASASALRTIAERRSACSRCGAGRAQAIAQEGFHQHDHLTAIGRPHAGFGQGQGDMVVIAAFAAAYAGKRRIH
jgi:hypothetical protein